MPELRDTTYTQFGTQIISSDPMREYLWAEQSYNKNARLKNTFKNSVETSGLPRNLSMTYGKRYQASRDLEMGFLVDGNFSGKYTYNTERMDRYVAYNDTSSYIDEEDESSEIVRTYDKLLRKGFIGLDRDIYQYATNQGFNFSYGITFRKNLRFGIRNVYTHTSKDNFTKAEGLSGELTYDYKTLYPGIDFDKNIETDNIYKAISIIAKRTVQINEDIKKELISKLEEFATPSESLEEIFENKEQIEVSKFYEKLPKAHAIAIDNWLNEKIYHRKPEKS